MPQSYAQIGKSVGVSAAVALGAALLAFFAGRSMGTQDRRTVADRESARVASALLTDVESYRLINPLLDCELAQPSRFASHVNLEREIRGIVEEAVEAGKASDVSVYFRALNDGPWIGVNDDVRYAPASMMKVPLLIAALRLAMDDPSFLKRVVAYDSLVGAGPPPDAADEWIRIGQKYTVTELLEHMIRFSDNEAMELVTREVTPGYAVRVALELGIEQRGGGVAGDFTSVREYASVFRLLYNSTYLNREMSQAALTLLTQTTFNAGITQRLPQGTVVAHKFGVRRMPDSPIRQLHDCGVVYFGKDPYVICIMTRGKENSQLASVIADISRAVYDAVSASTSRLSE